MTLAITPIDAANRPFFAGEVSGIDLTRGLTEAEVASMVMWNNRVTMQRARRYDPSAVRDLRRTTLTNEVSSLEQAPDAR